MIIRKFLIPLLFVMGLAGAQDIPLTGDLMLNYKGQIGYTHWWYPYDTDVLVGDVPGHVSTIEASGQFVVHSQSSLEFKFSPRIILDLTDPGDRSRRMLLDDFYMDYYSNFFELRMGFQIFSWKTVESVSHADFLNQTDREVDFFDAPKLGELSARARLIMPTSLEQILEFYYFGRFQHTRMPQTGNRQYFVYLDPESESMEYLDDAKEWRPQGAVRYMSSIMNVIDFSLFYFNGYDRMPGFKITGRESPAVHEYRPIHKGGLTFQGALGNWLLKGEGVYNNYINHITVYDTSEFRNKTLRADPWVAYTVGFEYTLYSLIIDNHDIGTILEYIGDSDTGKDPSEIPNFRLFRNHVFAGLRYTFNNVSDRSLLIGGFYDHRIGDVIASAEFEERLFRNFKLRIKYFGIFPELIPGSEKDEPSLLGQSGSEGIFSFDFDNLDRLDIEVLFTF